MTARRRAGLGSLVAIALLALAACTTIPSSGPVNEGNGVVSSAFPNVPIVVGPRADDSPTAIVNGFVTASSAGFDSDFTVARQFLTPQAAATWDPNARVTVYDSGALTVDFDEATSTVTYDIPVLATLDGAGRLTEAADGTRETLIFRMEMDENGQWRIAELEDGAILARAFFARQFTPVSLIFASVDETTQVPELRWLPGTKAVTLAARELVQGPSDWLAPAVHTGFPAASALEVDSVIVTDGVAKVQLTANSAGDPAQRSLAEEQMELTLGAIPGVRSVEVTVGGLPLGGDASAELQPAQLPSEEAAAFVNGRLGAWDGDKLWQVPDSVGGLPNASAGLAQSFGDPTAAWIVGGSSLVASSALAKGLDTLEEATSDSASPGATMDTTPLHKGTSLVSPTADRNGWFWTAERTGGGPFVAVKADGTTVKLDVDWLRGTTVQAISVSRDGARIAVLSQTGGKQLLEVASIVRGDDGAPLTIGEPLQAGADLAPAIDLAWVDDLSVAVLGEPSGDSQSNLWIVEVGGLTTVDKAVAGAIDVTAREGERSLVLVDEEGAVYVRSGTAWSRIATGPTALAYSG